MEQSAVYHNLLKTRVEIMVTIIAVDGIVTDRIPVLNFFYKRFIRALRSNPRVDSGSRKSDFSVN